MKRIGPYTDHVEVLARVLRAVCSELIFGLCRFSDEYEWLKHLATWGQDPARVRPIGVCLCLPKPSMPTQNHFLQDRKLVRHGIPEKLRGVVWYIFILAEITARNCYPIANTNLLDALRKAIAESADLSEKNRSVYQVCLAYLHDISSKSRS